MFLLTLKRHPGTVPPAHADRAAATSLKLSLTAWNVPRLLGVWVANVAVFLDVVTGALDVGDLQQLRELVAGVTADPAAGWPYLALVTVVTVFNGAIPRTIKEVLVFWPKTRPGARAFSHFMHRDSTINRKALQENLDPLPVCPREQNALWAGWLNEFEDDHRVRPGYRLYLFARDWTSIAVATLVLGLPLAFGFADDAAAALWYGLFLVVQFAFSRWLARVRGERLVMSVLSCKASSLARKTGGQEEQPG